MQKSVMRRAVLAGAVSLAVLVLAAGCGGSGHDDMGGMNHGGSAATASSKTGGTVNDADIQFAQMMIPHHQQAVEMAALAEAQAKDADIKQLAGQIKGAQDPEIKTMTGWLTAWGQPTAPPSGHSGHAMPGMMSNDEMAKLKAAKGTDFDRQFTRMMIAHHNGAIQMAKDEQANGTNPDAKALATTIEKTQTAEVDKLQKILDRL